MAKTMPNVTDVANKWKTNFGNAATAWQAGVNAVDQPPGVAAAAAKDRYVAGVNQAADKFARNVANVTLGDWKSACQTKGATRFASGAAAGVNKYQSKMAGVLQAIGQIRDSLPPRGDINANIARMSQMAMQLHQRAQQGF